MQSKQSVLREFEGALINNLPFSYSLCPSDVLGVEQLQFVRGEWGGNSRLPYYVFLEIQNENGQLIR